GAAASVRPRPLDADPATRRQLVLPGALERTPFLLVLRRRRAREMADEPVADLGAERLLLGGVVQRKHLGGRPKTASWVGSGGERGASGSTHHLYVAAGEAGATFSVRPAHVPTRRPGLTNRTAASSCVLSLPRQLCWLRHGGHEYHQTIHSRHSSPTQDAVLSRFS